PVGDGGGHRGGHVGLKGATRGRTHGMTTDHNRAPHVDVVVTVSTPLLAAGNRHARATSPINRSPAANGMLVLTRIRVRLQSLQDRKRAMPHRRVLLVFGCVLSVTAATFAQNDWKTYGNDPGHARFSTLTQISPQNVTRLTKAWEFDTKTSGRKWQNTAVVINNILYVTLQNGGVGALEPETGRELWRFETPVRG